MLLRPYATFKVLAAAGWSCGAHVQRGSAWCTLQQAIDYHECLELVTGS